MRSVESLLKSAVSLGLRELYNYEADDHLIQIQKTRKEFEGDATLVVFPLTKPLKSNPQKIGEELGNFLVNSTPEISSFNIVKGFLNLGLVDDYWIQFLSTTASDEQFGFGAPSGETKMVEFSSPNTNKPLHLGHLRNIFLGDSVAEILKANGHKVIRVQIINDRGIHICKSMLAWKESGKNETPESAGIKGDKLIGNYYVAFDKKLKEQIAELVNSGVSEDVATNETQVMKDAQELLQKWENKDPEVYALWEKMNQWVYVGFNKTYEKIGVSFDKLYYESNTYLLGKDEVLKGVDAGIFIKKDDGSVWCDLTDEGLDEKILLRSDGTSVYITQDIGTAILRYRDYPVINEQIYTVGNEQEYHFKVLFLILKKLGFAWAENCYHLSYGMVDLPSGKMKSREGTVVDADELVDEVVLKARQKAEESSKIDVIPADERDALYQTIGVGALKYYILKVDPKKRMLFNPDDSIDLHGNTAPFIQYAHARIKAILRKVEGNLGEFPKNYELNKEEKELIRKLYEFPAAIKDAGKAYSPSLVANYTYELVKTFNTFYEKCSIFKEDDELKRTFRLHLVSTVGNTVKKAMKLLKIEVPERM